jgi:hypothetical protein
MFSGVFFLVFVWKQGFNKTDSRTCMNVISVKLKALFWTSAFVPSYNTKANLLNHDVLPLSFPNKELRDNT